MSERVKGVYVAFEEDLSQEGTKMLIAAIRCLRHVADATPIEANSSDWMARQQVRFQLADEWLAMHKKFLTG